MFSGTSSSIRTRLWWNSHWMVLFQNCVRQSRSPTKMAATVQLRCYWKQLWSRWAITGSLVFRSELLPSGFIRRLLSLSSVVNFSHFNLILRNHWANLDQLCWNGSWMAPFQNCVRWSRLSTKMATKQKIEKGGGEEILIVHCCFSTSQNELKF